MLEDRSPPSDDPGKASFVYGDRGKEACCSLGGGGPRVSVARFFKCVRILLITLDWVMKEMIFISEPHFGHTNGSVR